MPRFLRAMKRNTLTIASIYLCFVCRKILNLFEDKIAEYTGTKRAVVCVSGTNALHLALMLVGVEQNDEVITQALPFVATANAISY